MEKRKLSRSKITGQKPANRGTIEKLNGAVPVIVQVSQSDYIPAGLELRKQITPLLFTANLNTEDLEKLEQDSQVVSVELNQTLQQLHKKDSEQYWVLIWNSLQFISVGEARPVCKMTD